MLEINHVVKLHAESETKGVQGKDPVLISGLRFAYRVLYDDVLFLLLFFFAFIFFFCLFLRVFDVYVLRSNG